MYALGKTAKEMDFEESYRARKKKETRLTVTAGGCSEAPWRRRGKGARCFTGRWASLAAANLTWELGMTERVGTVTGTTRYAHLYGQSVDAVAVLAEKVGAGRGQRRFEALLGHHETGGEAPKIDHSCVGIPRFSKDLLERRRLTTLS